MHVLVCVHRCIRAAVPLSSPASKSRWASAIAAMSSSEQARRPADRAPVRACVRACCASTRPWGDRAVLARPLSIAVRACLCVSVALSGCLSLFATVSRACGRSHPVADLPPPSDAFVPDYALVQDRSPARRQRSADSCGSKGKGAAPASAAVLHLRPSGIRGRDRVWLPQDVSCSERLAAGGWRRLGLVGAACGGGS